MTDSTTANQPAPTGAELRGAGLLFVIGGLYAVLVLEATLSIAAVATGALIGAGIAVIDIQFVPNLSRVAYAATFVVILGAILGLRWVITNYTLWIVPYLASIALGLGGAGLLAGVTLWVGERIG